jgi:hypothetical protein
MLRLFTRTDSFLKRHPSYYESGLLSSSSEPRETRQSQFGFWRESVFRRGSGLPASYALVTDHDTVPAPQYALGAF